MKDIHSLLAQLTLEEKASLCSGKNFWYLKSIERLGVPAIMVTDGPHGLRKQAGSADHVGLNESVPATCFPTASALAATWNRDLVRQVGVALGEECRQEKVGVILGPGANIKRSPLCGRNFEYFSEDPYLTGEIAASHIQGVQSMGVGTSLKHYAVNNQEYHRMTIDTIVDARALREIYLAGFEAAVRLAQPWTVMCSYNRIDGTYASDNAFLMRDILKDEWGHQGLVVTDWGAMNERVVALRAGVELEMPGAPNGNDASLVHAVRAGELDEAVLDDAVARLLALIFKAEETLTHAYTYDAAAHHALARQAASEGAVLLKNDGRLLPLPSGARIALVGRFAKSPRYQGAGSSLINPSRLDDLYAELAKLVGEANLIYAPGYTEKGDFADETLIEAALAVLKEADVVVVCAGLTDMYEVEGLDRAHMRLPAGHDALIQRVAAAHPKVVVVLSNGSPVEMPWIEAVPAVLEGYLGGQAGAGAIADILTGKVNPSGKLAETFPLTFEDTPAQPFPGGPAIVAYQESLYVGYRYYDSANVDVRFPFGHGLSYTHFTYRDLDFSQDGELLTATFKVKNTGARAGKEVAQLYVRAPRCAVFRPEKELKGFAKVALQPGEETTVSLPLHRRAFAYYDAARQDWVVEEGTYEILVGASSRDLRLQAALPVAGETRTVSPTEEEKLAAYFHPSAGRRFSQADFEALLGRPVPLNVMPQKGSFTINTPIREMHSSFIGRQLYQMLRKQFDKMIQGKEDTPTGMLLTAMAEEMPLRSILMMGSGMNRSKLNAFVTIINGQPLKGLWAFLRAGSAKP